MADIPNAEYQYGSHEKNHLQHAQVSWVGHPFPGASASRQPKIQFLQGDLLPRDYGHQPEIWGPQPVSVSPISTRRPETYTDPQQPLLALAQVNRSFFPPVVASTVRPQFLGAFSTLPQGFVDPSGAWGAFFLFVDSPPNRAQSYTDPQLPAAAPSTTWRPLLSTPFKTPARFLQPADVQVPGVPAPEVWGQPPASVAPNTTLLRPLAQAELPQRVDPAASLAWGFSRSLASISSTFLGTNPQAVAGVASLIWGMPFPGVVVPTAAPRFLTGDAPAVAAPEAQTWLFDFQALPKAPLQFLMTEPAYPIASIAIWLGRLTAEAPPPQAPPLRPMLLTEPQPELLARQVTTWHQPPESVAPPPPAPDLGAHGGWLVKPPAKRRAPSKSSQQEMEELLESLGTVGTTSPDSPGERQVVAKASKKLAQALQKKRPSEDDDEDDDILLLS